MKIEELVHAYIHSQCDFEREMVLTNHFQGDWEADILIINSEGFSHEIEIKLSKSDFKNDFKKFYTHHTTGEKFLKHEKISHIRVNMIPDGGISRIRLWGKIAE